MINTLWKNSFLQLHTTNDNILTDHQII